MEPCDCSPWYVAVAFALFLLSLAGIAVAFIRMMWKETD